MLFPDGMTSGYYKYITFDYDLLQKTGQVFSKSDQAYNVSGSVIELPNCDWIADHHTCPPIYVGWEHASKNLNDLERTLLRKSSFE